MRKCINISTLSILDQKSINISQLMILLDQKSINISRLSILLDQKNIDISRLSILLDKDYYYILTCKGETCAEKEPNFVLYLLRPAIVRYPDGPSLQPSAGVPHHSGYIHQHHFLQQKISFIHRVVCHCRPLKVAKWQTVHHLVHWLLSFHPIKTYNVIRSADLLVEEC